MVAQLSGALLLEHIFLLLVVKLLQLFVNLLRVYVLNVQVGLDILLLVGLQLLKFELIGGHVFLSCYSISRELLCIDLIQEVTKLS